MQLHEVLGDSVAVVVDPDRNAGSDIAMGFIVQRKGDHTSLAAQVGYGYKAGPHSAQATNGTCVADLLVFTRQSATSGGCSVQYVDNVEIFTTVEEARAFTGPATTAVPVAAGASINTRTVIT